MKKYPINFEYHLPERSEFYKMNTKEVKEVLEKEKRRFQNYIQKTEKDINEIIEHLTKGTNVVDDDYLFNDENIVDYGETKFAFIGEKNQTRIREINALYKEIKNGMDIYHTITENKIFGTLNKDVVLTQGVFPDIVKLNEIFNKAGFEFAIDYRNLIKNKDCYDEEVFLILKAIENQRVLSLITD